MLPKGHVCSAVQKFALMSLYFLISCIFEFEEVLGFVKDYSKLCE